MRFVHRLLLEIRSGGFPGVPDLASTTAGETVAEVSGRLYDAQEWMAGSSRHFTANLCCR